MVNIASTVPMDKIFKPLTSEAINAPHKTQGVYATPQSDTVELSTSEKPKKKSFWRGLGKLVLAAAVVGGALVGANKAGWLSKTEKYGVKYLKQAGEWTEKTATTAWTKIKNIVPTKTEKTA